jgi:hypothetical protein
LDSVFKTKLDADDGIVRLKARLVAYGNEQTGVSYNDSPLICPYRHLAQSRTPR